ncbi:unnamed protein product [Paramecium primaurelia]|uniref:Uncharacterized protein n=1 Tax=Paramecium primaurelia TaxID=5886 RepID=A0A8S1P9N3_PARPR|nr:unnamed protein product [Paramecium primaurelia]
MIWLDKNKNYLFLYPKRRRLDMMYICLLYYCNQMSILVIYSFFSVTQQFTNQFSIYL